MKTNLHNATFILLVIIFTSCTSKPPKETPVTIWEDSITVNERISKTMEETPVTVDSSLSISLWATDSLAPDPIALSMDSRGNVYLTRTNRQKNSEFDIRGHRDWMIRSIALQSVEDRRKFLRKEFSLENSDKNSWLKDLNGDSLHTWQDLAVEQDEIWKIQDLNNDGIADVAKIILKDFNEEITDVAGALLVRENDIFLGTGPDMWRLQDTNGDEVLDRKKSISHGYAVHIGFSGHGMSGAEQGPDGKIYWGIGDIGANIITAEGVEHKYPNQGVLVRSNPDGSNFEVFAAGLRNVHEFVFDDYGNIIGADNDGDHAGESERLVYIVEGSDAGWRANWQYGKYVDPKNNRYKVWMDEKLYTPRWDGQAAYIIPPISNFHNGPTGMLYNPGNALGEKWRKHFFLVEFPGTPTRSNIWAFTLKPKGAGFELASDKSILKGVLSTGIDFGPDGAMYIADWINGWGTKNYGRVWKLEGKNKTQKEKEILEETKKWIQTNFKDIDSNKLFDLLSHNDRRIRQKAQFELVNRNDLDILLNSANENINQLGRIHGLWGVGQLASTDPSILEAVEPLLADEDPELIAQTLKVMGDVGYTGSTASITELLKHQNSRVKFFSAQALGRISAESAIGEIIDMIDENNDEDVYLRHAGVLALARIGNPDKIIALKNSPERDLRIAAVLVLRRLSHPALAEFLSDEDEYIVTEAARAINDDWSIKEALPALSEVLNEERFTSEALLRRAINASVRVGSDKALENLINFTLRDQMSKSIKSEAFLALGNWAVPSVLDRVDGRYRGEIMRDPAKIRTEIKNNIDQFFKYSDYIPEIGKMLADLEITDYNDRIYKAFLKSDDPEQKSKLINVLNDLNYSDMKDVVALGMDDNEVEVRKTAIGLVEELEVTKESFPLLIEPIFKKGTLGEQQQLLKAMNNLPFEATEPVLKELVNKAVDGSLSDGLKLELMELVDSTYSTPLISKLDEIRSGNSVMDQYAGTLEGGDRNRGRGYFYWNSSGQCVRCHELNGRGGKVGPPLDNIGSTLEREQLLEALVEPGKRISPGYGSTAVTLKNGQTSMGIIEEEDNRILKLRTQDAEPLLIEKARIKERKDSPSAMPPMGNVMTKKEIRDMIEFLSTLK